MCGMHCKLQHGRMHFRMKLSTALECSSEQFNDDKIEHETIGIRCRSLLLLLIKIQFKCDNVITVYCAFGRWNRLWFVIKFECVHCYRRDSAQFGGYFTSAKVDVTAQKTALTLIRTQRISFNNTIVCGSVGVCPSQTHYERKQREHST